MYKVKNRLVNLCVISVLAIIPYTGLQASVTNNDSAISSNDKVVNHIAVRVRPGAEVKASPVRAHARREERRDDEQESDNEQYPNDDEYSEPTQQEEHDRGRPGGRR